MYILLLLFIIIAFNTYLELKVNDIDRLRKYKKDKKNENNENNENKQNN
jgi:hypothetical protein